MRLMRLFCVFILLVHTEFSLLCAVRAEEAVTILKTTKTRPKEEGLPVNDIVVGYKRDTFTITFVELDPNTYSLRLVVPSDPYAGGSSLTRFFADSKAVAAISGGFLRSYAPATPAGLLRYDKNDLNKLALGDKALGGVICFYPDRKFDQIAIAPRTDQEAISRSDDCLQAGPLLISNGMPFDSLEDIDKTYPNFSEGAYVRCWVAQDGRGTLMIGKTDKASLFALRHVMLMKKDDGGLGAVSAIGLTGTNWCGLIVSGYEPFGQATALLPNAIIAVRKTRP